MTNDEQNTLKNLHRDIAATLKGHSQPLVGAALSITVGDWLRQYHRPNLTKTQLDSIRITMLMRFLKGVANEISLGVQFEPIDDDDEEP